MTKKMAAEDRLAQLEEAQKSLRESIEATKRLSARSDALIERHRMAPGGRATGADHR